jgi:DNA-binding FadR family transcriptional regulator
MCETEEYFFRKKTEKQLKKIIQMLEILTEEVYDMSLELDALEIQVAETQGVEESVIVLLNGIKIQLDAVIAELAAQQIDNAKLTELRDSLDASEQALAQAAANFTPPVP